MFFSPNDPVATAADAAATGRVGMSTGPDPERSGVKIASRTGPRLRAARALHELTPQEELLHVPLVCYSALLHAGDPWYGEVAPKFCCGIILAMVEDIFTMVEGIFTMVEDTLMVEEIFALVKPKCSVEFEPHTKGYFWDQYRNEPDKRYRRG